MKHFRLIIILVIVPFTLSVKAYAGSDLFNLEDSQFYILDHSSYFESTTPTYTIQADTSPERANLLDMGLMHKLLGYGTLILGAGAAATGSDSSLHHNLAIGSASLGALTLATGYYEYGDMFEIDEGFSKYNLHIALGTIGAIGFAASALLASSDNSHAGLGVASAALMGSAFIIVYW